VAAKVRGKMVTSKVSRTSHNRLLFDGLEIQKLTFGSTMERTLRIAMKAGLAGLSWAKFWQQRSSGVSEVVQSKP
jgi:hypothetical protein